MIIIVVVTYLLEVLIDNVSARMNWRWMLGYVWSMGLALSMVNLVWLYAR
jgi:ech hydrogenase subunit B